MNEWMKINGVCMKIMMMIFELFKTCWIFAIIIIICYNHHPYPFIHSVWWLIDSINISIVVIVAVKNRSFRFRICHDAVVVEYSSSSDMKKQHPIMKTKILQSSSSSFTKWHVFLVKTKTFILLFVRLFNDPHHPIIMIFWFCCWWKSVFFWKNIFIWWMCVWHVMVCVTYDICDMWISKHWILEYKWYSCVYFIIIISLWCLSVYLCSVSCVYVVGFHLKSIFVLNLNYKKKSIWLKWKWPNWP